MALIEIGQSTAFGKLVPWANQLAIVTSVNAVADQGPERHRNRSGMFDRQIGNAAAGIQLVWRHDGLCRTHIDA